MRAALCARRTVVRALVLAVVAVGAIVAASGPALASGQTVIDSFTFGGGSWQTCGSSYFVYQQDASIMGGARELALRDGGSCHFGPYPAQMSIDAVHGTASWGGPNTYAPEQYFSYGTEIGTRASYSWSPNPNGGRGTPLHLSLTLSDEIVIQMQQVNNPYMGIRLRGADNQTYSANVPGGLVVGTNLVPLSAFPGLTAAAASAIDGISFQASNKNPANIVTELAIKPGDSDPPVASPTESPAANGAGWNSTDVTVAWNWTDSGSGIDASNCTQSSTSSGEGAITLTSTCKDNAGNSASDSVTVNVDKTAPADNPIASPAANGAGWNNSDVTVAWNWTDGGSGIDPSSCTQSSTSSGDGTITLSSTCQDAAGNSASDSRTVKVDQAAPTVAFSPDGQTYDVNDTVSIACSASDALSGVASSTCADVSGPAWSLGLGTHSLSASATDNAGNTGTGTGSYTVRATADGVCSLVQQWVSKPGVANSLCAKLQAAAASRARGNDQAADNQLGAFRNELGAQSGKSISADHASTLAQLSHAL